MSFVPSRGRRNLRAQGQEERHHPGAHGRGSGRRQSAGSRHSHALSKALQGVEGLPTITLDEVPRILGGSYGLGSRDFRPEHIIGAYEFATAGRARKTARPPLTE